MLQTIEGIIDQNGTLHLLEPMHWPKQRRVWITILKEEPDDELQDLARMSEVALARDWERPEEGGHMVQLAPDVAEVFPDADAVNEALRFLIRITRENQLALSVANKGA